MKVSAINHRIGVVILAFTAMSLGASLLPLVPGIRETVPLDFLERRQALGVYGAFLLGFMALLFPAMVRLPEDRRSVMPWAWVGGFALAFAGVPTFVLAYIAGVHVRGVVEILMWAGAFHGLALVSLQVFGHRWRILPIAVGFLLAVVIPAVAEARDVLDVGAGAPSPFRAVGALASGARAPDPALPAAITAVLYGIVVASSGRARRAKAAAVVALVAMVVVASAAAPQTATATADVVATTLTGDLRVPGRPLPLRLEASRPGVLVEVRAGAREVYRWRPEPGGPLAVWTYVDGDGEVVVSADGESVISLRQRPAEKPLVLVVGDGGDAVPRTDVEVERVAPGGLPDSTLGLLPFAGVVVSRRDREALAPRTRAVIDEWVRSGGSLHVVSAGADVVRRRGAGRVVTWAGGTVGDSARFTDAALPEFEPNLYSKFAVPDWGRVELTPIIAFLAVYHVVFWLTFLLPLVLDARKGLGVYLWSVGSVLALVIVGAYFALTRVFLEESQLLQQNVLVAVVDAPAQGEPGLRVEQLACFASFNDQPVRLEFEAAHAPWLVHAGSNLGAGPVEIAPDGSRLVLPAVPVDRRARKQVVSLSRAGPSPIGVERTGPRAIRLRAVAGVADATGLWTARRVAAFVREGGRLHAARAEGAAITWSDEPARTGWGEVLGGAVAGPEVVPFLRYLLGRKAGAHDTVAVVLVEGLKPLEIEEGALHVHDIVQVLMIPLDTVR